MNLFQFLKNLFAKQETSTIPWFLIQVNRNINKQVWYKADKFGDTFNPAYDLKEGDCEDIAGTKAIHLAADYAVKPDQLKPLLVRVDYPNGPQKIWHLVLVAQVDGVEYVLDNHTDKVYSLVDLYRNLKVQDNRGFELSYTPWNHFQGGTRARAKRTQDKYNKLFKDLLTKPLK